MALELGIAKQYVNLDDRPEIVEDYEDKQKKLNSANWRDFRLAMFRVLIATPVLFKPEKLPNWVPEGLMPEEGASVELLNIPINYLNWISAIALVVAASMGMINVVLRLRQQQYVARIFNILVLSLGSTSDDTDTALKAYIQERTQLRASLKNLAVRQKLVSLLDISFSIIGFGLLAAIIYTYVGA